MKKVITIIVVVLVYSCSDNDTDTIRSVNISKIFEPNIRNLSDIASDINYIPLQTTRSSLLRYIYGIKSINNKIYVSHSDGISIFDKNGTFLFGLNKKGQGPGEYINMIDWDISPENKLLMVLSLRKLFFYKDTLGGYMFINSINLSDEVAKARFVPGQQKILLSNFSPTGQEKYRNIIIDMMRDTFSVRPNYYKYTVPENGAFFGSANFNLIYEFNGSVYFKEMFCDTIFKVSQSCEILPSIILNTNGFNITPDVFAEHINENMAGFLTINNLMEVPRFIFYRFIYRKKMYIGFYDKTVDKINIIDSQELLKDDIAGGTSFEPKYAFRGKLYSWIDALVLKKHVFSDSFKETIVLNPDKKNDLLEFANSLNESDNPVLVVVTPKN